MQTVINIYQSENKIIRDAVDKIVVQVYRKKREDNHQSFLITGCSGGCGTTNVAINMSVALANAGWKTVLVDCDIRKGMRYKRLNQEINVGLADFLTGETDDVIYATNNEQLDYIPCGSDSGSPVRLIATSAMEQFDAKLKEKYDFVVYDFPSVNIVPDAGIMIPVVDDVLLVAAMNETTRSELARAKAAVKKTPGKYMGVIANKLAISDYRHYINDYDYFGEDKLKKTQKYRLKRAKK
jgi:capsular exopolysaccharide synthesis family protein